MRDYQRQKNNPYQLPNPVYHQTLWFIRSYRWMQDELNDILLESPSHEEGMPSGSNLVHEAEMKTERRNYLYQRVRVIEESMVVIPEEYRKGIWDNIQSRKSYPMYADRRTYGRWKAKYVWTVATKMGFVH